VKRLQTEIKHFLKDQFGLAWHKEKRDTDALLIEVSNPHLLASKISTDFPESRSIPEAASEWENYFGKPVLDETGLTNRYDKKLGLIPAAYVQNRTTNLDDNNTFLEQYGLQLVPAHRPMEWLALDRAANANTTTTTRTKHMNYTLVNLQNNKKIPNPTDADVRAVVISLKDDFGPVLELNTPGVEQPLQMDKIEKALFGFTCTDGDMVYTTKNGRECSTEVAIKIIISYRDGTADWKTMSEWDHLKP